MVWSDRKIHKINEQPMHEWDSLVRSARECHTKESWNRLFKTHHETISSINVSKPLADLFRILKSDPQCLQYDHSIWVHLLNGCLSCWNLDLGKEISSFTEQLASAAIAIPSSEIFLVRDIVSLRFLRLQQIINTQKIKACFECAYPVALIPHCLKGIANYYYTTSL